MLGVMGKTAHLLRPPVSFQTPSMTILIVGIDGVKRRLGTIIGPTAVYMSMSLAVTFCCFIIRRMDSSTLFHSFINSPSIALSSKSINNMLYKLSFIAYRNSFTFLASRNYLSVIESYLNFFSNSFSSSLGPMYFLRSCLIHSRKDLFVIISIFSSKTLSLDCFPNIIHMLTCTPILKSLICSLISSTTTTLNNSIV